MHSPTALAADPRPARRPLTLRRRASMLAVSLLLAFLFVVGPAQQARAVLWAPVVGWAVGTLARSALPTVATRLGLAAFTTPLRGAIVSRMGITTVGGGLMTWGRLGMNTAGLVGIGATGVGLGQMIAGENPLEFGLSQEALDDMNGYIRAEAGLGSIGAPQQATSNACIVRLESYQFMWSEARGGFEIHARFSGGPYGAIWSQSPYNTTTSDYRYSQCSAPGSVTGNPLAQGTSNVVNVVTGQRMSGVGAILTTATQTRNGDAWTSDVIGFHRTTGITYTQQQGWHIESFSMRRTATTGALAQPGFIWEPFVNPFSPTGEDVGGGLPEGTPYYGTRHCENSLSETRNITVQSTTGLPIPPECPDGWWSQGYTITQGDPMSPNSVELMSIGTNPGWNLDENQANRYPGCATPSGASTGICQLSVTVDNRQCAYGVVGCAGWMELSISAPDRVVCYWGQYRMPATDCAELQHAYKTPYGVGVPQMIDVDPVDWTPFPVAPGSDPIMTPAPLPGVDPGLTPWPNPGVNPPPSTDPPGSGALPLTGTNPHIQNGTEIAPAFDMMACLGGMWSWNPINWVYIPVKCSLEWAFVPRPAVIQDATNGIYTGFRASAFGPLVSGVEGMGGWLQEIYGCEGLPFDLSMFGIDFQGRLFNSCSPPWDGVASFTRNILTGVIYFGGFLAILRYGAGVFGFMALGGAGGEGSEGRVRFK